MYYKGNNIGLNYDAATGTWAFSNEPQDFIDKSAFSTPDPVFEYATPYTDDSEDENTTCPEGYVYDNTLKQCIPDPAIQNQYTDKTYQKDDSATDPNNKSTNPFGIWVPPVQNIDGTWEAGYTKQMPNTMDKFTQEQLIDWGKSKGYITKNGTIVGAMQASDKLGMYKGIGQFLNDRQYNNWLKRIENKGMAKSESGPAGKVVVVVGQQFDSFMQKKLDAFKTVANNAISNYTEDNYLKESGVGAIRDGQDSLEKEKLKKAQYDTEIKAIEARRKADQLRREAEQNQKDREKQEREEREIKDFTNLKTGQSTTDSSGDTYTKKDDGGYTFTPSKTNTTTKTYENKRKYGGYTGSTAGRGNQTSSYSSAARARADTKANVDRTSSRVSSSGRRKAYGL
tara:strand:+ start:173 stop:1363 length:1191 start_codon:yes stop_codon:yes gene_type:complete